MTINDTIPAVYLWWVDCNDAAGRPVGGVVLRSCCGPKAVANAMRIAWPIPRGQQVIVNATPLDPSLLLPASMMGCLLGQLECSAARVLLQGQIDSLNTKPN